MNKSAAWKISFAVVAMFTCSIPGWADEAMSVSDAWVREAPPHAEVSAAYLTLHNPGNRPHVLTGASSPQFQKAEIHVTRIINDQAHMQRVMELTVAAHGNVEFKPGEYHLMLIQPRQPLKAGDTVELTLTFKDASQISVRAPVRNGEEEIEPQHHHDMNM